MWFSDHDVKMFIASVGVIWLCKIVRSFHMKTAGGYSGYSVHLFLHRKVDTLGYKLLLTLKKVSEWQSGWYLMCSLLYNEFLYYVWTSWPSSLWIAIDFTSRHECPLIYLLMWKESERSLEEAALKKKIKEECTWRRSTWFTGLQTLRTRFLL
jgi:hypothetical protein